MAWVYLIIAGLFEMLSVALISNLHKKRNFQALLLLIFGFGASFLFLGLAMETLPMGTAYAIWTGIGASGGALLGMIYYGEAVEWRRIFFISLIIVSTIGLKLIAS
ncbi:DMT family transporter [Salirhabdus sp. Marseille-P4669]|uniref:DMT family transporter n=1 Tax=Salirhabdus sp. Marseille-P4669 TaxID=2042310 RepID=UPI000C7E3774|nr:multidrug efflux SMR transporter [Salirhabdus sp. Marseille-P4669]